METQQVNLAEPCTHNFKHCNNKYDNNTSTGLITNLEVRSAFTALKCKSYLGCWQTKQTKVQIFNKRKRGLSFIWPGFVLANDIVHCC